MRARSASAAPYYGWFVLAASAVPEMLATGATAYAAGLFVLPLQAEFHLSRANASSSFVILFLGAIFLSPFAGRILDRYPIRLAVSGGALLFSAAMAVIALTTSLWLMMLMLLVPAAMGIALVGPMTTATLASRWFFKRRGLALGIAAVATSAGGFVVVPFLSRAIQLYGWRTALLLEAAVFFVIITLLALLILRDNPFRAGLADHPENEGRTDAILFGATREVKDRETPSHPAILGNRGFWAPGLLLAAVSGVCQGIVISAPPYVHQLGFAPALAALLISAFSIAAALTKIAAGIMADFWDKRVLMFGSAIFMSLSLVILFFFNSYDALLAACCMAGIALGGALPTSAAVLAARFGTAHFGTVMGWVYVLVYVSTISVTRYMGAMFDRTGSYHAAFGILLVTALLISFLAWAMDLRVNPGR